MRILLNNTRCGPDRLAYHHVWVCRRCRNFVECVYWTADRVAGEPFAAADACSFRHWADTRYVIVSDVVWHSAVYSYCYTLAEIVDWLLACANGRDGKIILEGVPCHELCCRPQRVRCLDRQSGTMIASGSAPTV